MRDEELRKKKRVFVTKIILAGLIVLSFIVLLGVLAIKRMNTQELKRQDQQVELEDQREPVFAYEYEGLERLIFIERDEEIIDFKVAFESHARSSLYYGVFTKVTVVEESVYDEAHKLQRFYLALDNNDMTIVEGLYDGADYTFGYYKSGIGEEDGIPEVTDEEGLDGEINLDVPDATGNSENETMQ